MMRVSKFAQASSQNGVIKGYFLSSYSAKRLNMHTGNAGGSHNLRMFDTNSHAGNNLNEMFKLMETDFLLQN